jgi:hypothetical protein
MEKELFGDAADPLKQHTGINFEKYEDIPVEATGAGVPDPVQAFTHPPLDPVLLENIGYAMYTTPTPVQKYSIPIVAGGRDLMACAQVSMFLINIIMVVDVWNVFPRLVPGKPEVSFFPSFLRHSRKVLVLLLNRRKPTATAPARLTPPRLFLHPLVSLSLRSMMRPGSSRTVPGCAPP